LGLLTLRIAQAIESGLSHNEIGKSTEQWIRDTRIFVNVKTLKYMVRGGRVSYFKGFISNILNINPSVSMDENGKSYVFGKTYSQKSNMEKVMDLLYKEYSGKKIWNYIILHAQNEEGAEWYVKKMKKFTKNEPVGVVNFTRYWQQCRCRFGCSCTNAKLKHYDIFRDFSVRACCDPGYDDHSMDCKRRIKERKYC
jgi:DegV family protein with EDD domain